jgi:HemY protein
MKTFRYLLLLLALAVLGALAWQPFANDDSQVIVNLRHWTYTTNVSQGLLLLAIVLLLAWAVAWLLRLPLRLWRGHRHQQHRARLAGGLLALHEGRWARAEKSLEHAANDPAMRLPARLGAARAARERGDAVAVERHLQAAGMDADHAAIALDRADALLRNGHAADAILALDAAALKTPLPPRALALRARALAVCGRANEAYGTLGALRAAQALSNEEHAALESMLAQQSLRESPDANALADRWDRLLAPLRAQPDVVIAYADRASALQLEDAAASAIEAALKSQWSEALALQYGRIPSGRPGATEPGARLAVAEGWLRTHSDSPALGITVGRLSRQQKFWGKAEGYLHRAIAQGGGSEAWEELGNVHTATGDDALARQCYANALRAARGEPIEELPGRDIKERIFDESVLEERSELGVPRLPMG